jgi:hypothetical protein
MLVKWVARGVAENADLQDPRDKAKAILPEIQSREVLRRPTATATRSGDNPCSEISLGSQQLRRLCQRTMSSKKR